MNKLLYLGNPKCGSTLIRTTFQEDFKSGKLNLAKKNNKSFSYTKDPLSIVEKNYFIFSVVRNPFDLLVSYFTSNHMQNPNRGYIANFRGIGSGNRNGKVSIFSRVKH